MNLLYICTHNRCRSILSEAITRQKAGHYINVRSAGSQPAGEVHPLSLRYLRELGYDTTHLTSKSWDDLGDFKPDLVITVCDQAAGESCPLWLGATPKLHWGLNDPSNVQGSEQYQREAFINTIQIIEQRVDQLIAIATKAPAQRLDALREIIQANTH